MDYFAQKLYFSDLLPDLYPEIYKQFSHISHELIPATKDVWCRDYMPIQRHDQRLIGFRYDPSYLKKNPELKSPQLRIWDTMNLDVEYHADIVADGGHFQLGKDVLYASEALWKENPAFQKEALSERLAEAFQVKDVVWLPPQKGDFTGHLDGLLRFPAYNSEPIVFDHANETSVSNAWKKSWQIFSNAPKMAWPEIPEEPQQSARGCYLNYLQLCSNIYVPTFGIDEDNSAERALQPFIPKIGTDAKRVVPINNCNRLAREGGVLNCISWAYNDLPNAFYAYLTSHACKDESESLLVQLALSIPTKEWRDFFTKKENSYLDFDQHTPVTRLLMVPYNYWDFFRDVVSPAAQNPELLFSMDAFTLLRMYVPLNREIYWTQDIGLTVHHKDGASSTLHLTHDTSRQSIFREWRAALAQHFLKYELNEYQRRP